MKWKGLVIPVALVLAACAPLPPRPRPVVTSWRPHGTVAVGRPVAAWQPRWWRAVGSRPLDALVAGALRGNPSLAVADARVHAAVATLREQRGSRRLQVSAAGGLTAEHFSQDGLHASANGQSVLYGEVDPLIARIHITQFGHIDEEVRAAFGGVQAAAADRAEARLIVTTQIVRTYFAAEAARTERACWQAMRRDARRLLALSRIRQRDGLSGARAVYADEERLDVASQGYRRAATALVRLRNILGALAGRGPAFGRALALGALPARGRLPLPSRIPLALVAHRPDVVAARRLVAVAAARVGAARAAFYPDVNLAFFAGWNSISLRDLFDPMNLARAIGPTVTLPIFEGGTLRAGLARQEAAFVAARAQYQGALVAAVREVADGVARLRRERQDLATQAQALRAAQRQEVLARQAFRAGLTDRAPLLQADSAWWRERARQMALRAARAATWARIEEAIDGQAG